MGRAGFAYSTLCLASDLHKLTQSHSDPHPRDRLTQICADPPSSTETSSRSFNLTQIPSVSSRSTQPQIKDSLRSARFRSIQIHAASHRFTQIHKISHSLIQIHLISFKQSPIHSDTLESTQVHTASLQILSASLRLIQIH